MTTVTTTAKLIFSSLDAPVTIDIHADSDNSDTVNISGIDPSVTVEFEELSPGQSITISGFKGTIYAIAESGTQSVFIPFVIKSSGVLIQK